jgi:hypothetical protein
MTQYIDKDTVKVEIERIKKEECPIDTYEGRIKLFYFERFLSFLDTLEVKEEALCVKDAFKSGYDMGVLQTTNKINSNTKEVDLDIEIALWANALPEILLDDVERLAKYFFELGFKAQKGE